MRTTLGQVISLENIIATRQIKLYEADQLQKLYIIKLKRDICMLETNVKKFLDENKSHIDLRIEINGDNIREEMEDKTIRMISV